MFIILILAKVIAITTFYSCDLSASGEINKKGDYAFSIVRSGDSVNHPINLYTNYYIQIDYPWTINSDYTCYNELDVLVTCTYSTTQRAIISNYFAQNYGSTDYDQSNGFSFTIILKNILNPSYSGTYDSPIQVSIGYDGQILEQCPNLGVYPNVSPGTATCYGDGLQSKVNTTSNSMSLSIIVANSLAIESYLVVQFTQYWQNDKITKTIIPGSITCSIYGNNILISSTTCTLSGYTIKSTLGNGYTAGNITIIINGVNSPSFAGPVGTFILQTYNPNSKLIDQCTTSSISNWLPNQVVLSSMSWTLAVNQVEKLNLLFQLNSQIAIGDTITITIPKEIIVNSTILTSIKDTKSSFFTTSTSTFGLSGQVITITSTKSFTATLTNIQLTFYNVGSPPSIKPTSSVSISTYRGSYLIDQSSTSLTISATYGSITSVSIIAVNNIINQYSDYNFAITLNNHLLSDGYIVIQFPTQFNLAKVTSINNYLLNSTSYSSTFSVSSQQLTISSLSTADIPSNSIISFTISQVQNQFSANISNTFTLYTYYSKSTQNYLVDQHTTYQMSKFATGTLDSSSIKISTTLSTTGYQDTYTIQFVNTNGITASGYILVTLSSEITITSGSQTCYINTIQCTCTQSSTSVIKLIVPSNISSSTTITIQINTMLTNPSTLIPVTNAVTIATYDDQGLNIDNGQGGTLTLLYLSKFTLQLSSRSSQINGVQSTYTFILNFEVTQINGIFVVLTFPSDLVFNLNSCSSTSSLSVACTYSNQQLLLQLICSTCSAIPNNQDLLITVNQIVNYYSLMPISISSGYSIQDQSNSLSKQSSLKSSLIITNNAANSISTFSQNYQYGYLNTLDNYSFSFTLNNKLINYFQIVIGVPSDITVYTDSTPTTISNDLPAGCTVQIVNQKITISGYTASQIGTFEITITNLLNPSTIKSASPFTINTYSVVSNSYYIMDSSNLNYYNHKCTLPCKNCDSTTLTQCSSCYDSSKSTLVNQQIYLYSSTCVTDCSKYVGYFTQTGSYICQQCSSECKTCQNEKTYCLTCSGTLKFHNNKCLDACPTGYYNNLSQCYSCINNCDTCSDGVSCTMCSSNYYLYQSTCTANCPTGITIASSSYTCDLCTNNCKTCQSTTSYCLSCNTNYLFYQNTCISKCQDGTYANGEQCSTCLTKCKTCSDGSTCSSCNIPDIYYLNDCISSCPDQFFQTTSYTCSQCSSSCYTCETNQYKCTSCLSPSNLYNNTCLTTCPDKYYADNNKCVNCVSPCNTCKSSTQCTSCVTQTPILYYYNYSCNTSCLSYYAPENGECVACRLPCKQCTTSPDTCSLCYPNTYLLGTLCVTDCGAGNYQNNQQYVCSSCSTTCKTCSTYSVCTSCNDGLYLFQSTCVSSCQDGYYSNNSQCYSCLTTCSACTDGATCSKCKDSLILYNNECLASCPSNLFLVDNSCIGCQSPCLTCNGTPETCLTCVQNTYLNTNSECVTSCSDGYYADQVSNKCIACVSPCLTCSSSTVCLSCLDQTLYFYDYSCHSECKTNYVPVNGVCTACQSPCSSCTNKPTNCNSCLSSTYLSDNSCLSTCASGYYADSGTSSCLQCVTPCLTCTSETVCTSCLSTSTKFIFYDNECISSCPTGYYEQDSTCLVCTETSSNEACQSTVQVIESIQTEKFIPLPFTILTFIFIISVIVAKIQRPETFIPGAICAFGGFFEWCSHGVLLYLSYLQWDLLNLQNYIIMGSLAINYILNIIHLIFGRIVFHKDPIFQQWFHSRGVIRITYIIVTLLSLVTTFKVNKVLLSRYFGFYFFKLRISNVSELLPFNIVSLISILFNSIPLIVASTIIINIHDVKDQLYISSIDCVIVTFLLFITQIWEAQKEEEFFHDPSFQSLNQSLAYRIDQQPEQIEQQEQPEQHSQQQEPEQPNIESTNNQKKNFLTKNKSATIFQQKDVVPSDQPYFQTQNSNSSAQKRFEQYIKKTKPDNSLDLSSILHEEHSQHPLNDFSQEILQYEVLQFQNPEQPVGNRQESQVNFSSDIDFDLQQAQESTTPKNFVDNGSKFKKRNKTMEIITIAEPITIQQTQVEDLNLQQEDVTDRDQQQNQSELIKEQQLEQERIIQEKIYQERQKIKEEEEIKLLKLKQEQQQIKEAYQQKLQQLRLNEEQIRLEHETIKQEMSNVREQALVEKQKANDERKRIEEEEKKKREEILILNKVKEEQLIREKEEEHRLRIEEEKKKQDELLKREEELRQELEREKEEKLKFQIQLQEKLQREEQERIEAEQKMQLQKIKEEEARLQLIKEEEIRLARIREEEAKLQKIKEEASLLLIKEEQARLERIKEEEARLAQIKQEQDRLDRIKEEEARLAQIKEEQARLQKIKEEEARLAQIKEEETRLAKIKEEEARLNKIKEEEERLEKIKEDEARLKKEKEDWEEAQILEQQRENQRLAEQQRQQDSDSKNFQLIQFDYNQEEEEDEIPVNQENQRKRENIFIQISDDEEFKRERQLENESVQSAQEEIINFDDYESKEEDQNQFRLNNPENMFVEKKSSHSITFQNNFQNPAKINKTIQDQPNIKTKTQYQFLPKKTNQMQQSRQRSQIKYPNSNTPNKLQVGLSYNNFQQKPVNKEKDERYLRQKEEIYLQHLPNYYEKQIQDEMKKKKLQQQRKKQQYEIRQNNDEANLDF